MEKVIYSLEDLIPSFFKTMPAPGFWGMSVRFEDCAPEPEPPHQYMTRTGLVLTVLEGGVK